MRRVTKRLSIFLGGVMFTFFYCEYLIYYVAVIQCSWPTVNGSGNPFRTLIIADTHLLGPNGHIFDKLRREWQMHQAFQAIITLRRPDAVFVLGDLFDEGEWSNEEEFKDYVQRFNKLFAVPNSTAMCIVAGNHDLGFHSYMRSSAVKRFSLLLKSPLVQFLDLNGNYFVLVNSMGMHGDGCELCEEARTDIDKISEMLENKYNYGDGEKNKTRPILMQHFPLYRLSDAECTEPDAPPLPERNKRFRNRIDALSKESSYYLISRLKPRVVFGAHTHHGCLLHHSYENLVSGFYEYTVPSFSWRNRVDPKYMLVTFTPDQYAVNKCWLPQESTLITTAVILLFISLYLSLRLKKIGSSYL